MTEPHEQTSRTSSSSSAGTPLWVKVFAIAFLALVVLVVVMIAGGHGPGRHTPPANGIRSGEQRPFGGQPPGRQTPPFSARESEVRWG
jgi:hypothetical protein